MALEGTLRDFSLADIFQLIGIQRKTGVLTLKNKTDVVTVSFLSGNVVSADSLHKNLEDRLGSVLVKSGYITGEQLQNALRIQKSTLQRLGYVLLNERFVSRESLQEALQLQVTQIVYRLFRWRDGDYHFSQEESIDYDRENFTPIAAQNILMEGIRMIDEWPIIEKRIKSFDMVFERADDTIQVEEGEPEEQDLDLALDGETPSKPAGKAPEPGSVVRMLPDEIRVYSSLDARATVHELIDRTRLGEFDTCRILNDLAERGLVREVRSRAQAAKVDAQAKAASAEARIRAGYLVLLVAVGLSLLTMNWNPLNLIPIPLNESPTVDTFRRILSRNRIEQIDHALYLFFLEHQRLAPTLTDLVEEGFLRPEAVEDPWGRFYAYEILPGGYRVVGFDNGGVEDPSLAKVRQFPSGVLPGAAGAPAGSGS